MGLSKEVLKSLSTTGAFALSLSGALLPTGLLKRWKIFRRSFPL